MVHSAPSISKTSFNCPQCGANAQQFWRNIFLRPLKEDTDTPHIWTEERIEALLEEDHKPPEDMIDYLRELATGVPAVYDLNDSVYNSMQVHNLFASKCYNCKKTTFWLYDKILWPHVSEAPPANNDLPEDIKADYREAGAILNLSPRGAAALLRLSIQKLCAHLNSDGKDLNIQIGELVKRGLDARVQQALDVVRVIGNNAVHPGKIDLKDDLDTALRLFTLVNLICEKMISEPAHVEAMFASLPDGVLEGITKRDKGD